MNATPDPSAPPPPEPPAPRRLTRTAGDRIVGGVCGGLGRYFGVDPTLVRIGFVGLALLGGAGLVVYAAALVLVPLDDEQAGTHSPRPDRLVAAAVVAAVVLGAVVLGGFGFGIHLGPLVPLGLLALAGLAAWWLASGERPAGGAGDVARRAVKGIGLLVGCAALALASLVASALGGGVVVAALVIASGAGLVAAAFAGGARWLVLPAVAVALPLAFVSAAGIDLDGGVGDRHERPATLAALPASYRLGAGELVIDLRELRLPAGDRPLAVRIGAGHAVVLVSDDVCVASRATVGIGAVAVFDRDSGGIDVAWSDRRRAPAHTPRLVLDGDVGLGLLEVRHSEGDDQRPFRPSGQWDRPDRSDERNAACSGAA